MNELYLFRMVDTSDPSASVETLIFDRLAEAGLPAPAADLVVAALLGDDDLGAALGSQSWQRPPAPEGMPAGAVPGFFLLIDAERRLTAARKQLEETSKTARQALPDLLSRLTDAP